MKCFPWFGVILEVLAWPMRMFSSKEMDKRSECRDEVYRLYQNPPHHDPTNTHPARQIQGAPHSKSVPRRQCNHFHHQYPQQTTVIRMPNQQTLLPPKVLLQSLIHSQWDSNPCWMVLLGREPRSFCRSGYCTSYRNLKCISRSFSGTRLVSLLTRTKNVRDNTS